MRCERLKDVLPALTLRLRDFAAAEPRSWMPVRINAGDCGGDSGALARLLAPEPARNNGNRSVRTRPSEADTAAW